MTQSGSCNYRIAMLALALCLAQTVVAQEDGKKPLLAGTSSPDALASASVPATRPAPVAEGYEIGAGDVLAIDVWKEPELSRVLPVRPDGNLALPLIGEIKASGLTTAELQGKITQLLQRFLDTPSVTVMVQETRSRRVNIVGEVQRPGTLVLAQPTTILDAISLAGGLRNFAKSKRIYVLRPAANGSPERIPFDYSKVIRGENHQQNVLLQPGDTIVVP